MLLSIEGANESNVWITRAMALSLVARWAQKIEDYAKTEISIADRKMKNDIAVQHQLAIENNEIQKSKTAKIELNNQFLAKKIKLSFRNNDSKIVISDEVKKIELILSEKEVHALLEMFQICTNEAKWRESVKWPAWLN